MINKTSHKLPYGTILSVVRRNKYGYMATEAEIEKVIPVYVPFEQCVEI